MDKQSAVSAIELSAHSIMMGFFDLYTGIPLHPHQI
jgi:hypothetical protein